MIIDPANKAVSVIKKILFIVQLFLGFLKYSCLAPAVLSFSAVLLFVVLSIKPNFSFRFLAYFSIINSQFKNETFSFGTKEILEIFSFVGLVCTAVFFIVKWAIKKLGRSEIRFSIKVKFFIFGTAVSLLYFLAFLVVIFSKKLDGDFYFVFGVFYLVNISSLAGYFFLTFLQNKIAFLAEKYQIQ